jgi:hypothetical protein
MAEGLKQQKPRAKGNAKGGNNTSGYAGWFVSGGPKISTQPNTDSSYIEIGVIHKTVSSTLNALSEIGVDFANVFGRSGGVTDVYNGLIHKAIEEVHGKLVTKQKICNLRIETNYTNQPSQIIINLSGTLLQQIK